MKLLPLTNGMLSMVDDDIYEKIGHLAWYAFKSNNTNYVQRNLNGTTIKIHREILNIEDPKVQIDHKDGNGLNNQKSNLRICSHAQNMANRRANKKGSSKFKGVSWHSGKKKWDAQIAGKTVGRYDSEIEAALAYNVSASFKYREFAKLNNINI